MPLDYRNILITITDILSANTNTLDDSITVSPRLITRGDPSNIPVQVDNYPAIFTHLISKSEDYEQVGRRTKDITLNFNVYALVQLSTGNDQSDLDCQNLARNIETVFRTANGVTLSNTVLFTNPRTCSFDRAYKDGIYLSAAIIDLEVRVLTQ